MIHDAHGWNEKTYGLKPHPVVARRALGIVIRSIVFLLVLMAVNVKLVLRIGAILGAGVVALGLFVAGAVVVREAGCSGCQFGTEWACDSES